MELFGHKLRHILITWFSFLFQKLEWRIQMTIKIQALLFALTLTGLFLAGCAPIAPESTNLQLVDPTQVTQSISTPATVEQLEPFVSISPTRGSSGTIVQVIANGFPANTPVSVGLGPVNAGFGEVG